MKKVLPLNLLFVFLCASAPLCSLRFMCSTLRSHILCFLLLCVAGGLHAAQIPLTIEVAESTQQREWGLMGRADLPADQGMLFIDPRGSIWMFNVYIDLSVAFLDSSSKIISIAELKAYPEKMDPNRPILQIHDLKKYPYQDKIFQFFLKHAKPVPKQTKYALEMNGGWFKKHQVKPGDTVHWNRGNTQAFIVTSEEQSQ